MIETLRRSTPRRIRAFTVPNGLSIRSAIFVHDLSRRRSVKRLFRAARKLQGLRRLHSTLAVLDRGYIAFREIDEIRPFVRSMRQGEAEYMERVFRSQPDSDSPS